MKVKRSKDLVSGVKLRDISVGPYYVDPKKLLQVNVPNRFMYGTGSTTIAITKKEARRLASALLKYTESME